jgi:hypothetical protein
MGTPKALLTQHGGSTFTSSRHLALPNTLHLHHCPTLAPLPIH